MASLAVSLLAGGAVVWQRWQTRSSLPGIASGNGRLEATELDVATKLPGRIEAVLANEGDLVQEGQIVTRMDAAVLRAQLREAEAERRRLVEECKVAAARITQRESELVLANIELRCRAHRLRGARP